MLGALLRFCLPLSIAGTGVATALGASSSNSERNNASSSNFLTVSSKEIQARKKIPLPISESPILAEHFTLEQENRKDIFTEPLALKSDKLPSISELEVISIKEGPVINCQIIDPDKTLFESLSKNVSDYYTVSCENRGNEIFIDNWKGLFLKKLFLEQEALDTNKKFDLNVTISGMDLEEGDSDMSEQMPEDEENPYGITFSSLRFVNTELKGKWNYEDVGAESGAIVKILNSSLEGEKIYLFFQ